MKITETITRECCRRRDLRPYSGARKTPIPDHEGPHLFFCAHCGQVWQSEHDVIPPATENIAKIMTRITL